MSEVFRGFNSNLLGTCEEFSDSVCCPYTFLQNCQSTSSILVFKASFRSTFQNHFDKPNDSYELSCKEGHRCDSSHFAKHVSKPGNLESDSSPKRDRRRSKRSWMRPSCIDSCSSSQATPICIQPCLGLSCARHPTWNWPSTLSLTDQPKMGTQDVKPAPLKVRFEMRGDT